MAAKEIERQFVGGLLVSPENIPQAQGLVEPEDFEDKQSAAVYTALVALVEAGRTTEQIDFFAVARHLARSEVVQRQVAKWCADATDGIPRRAFFGNLARAIRRQATLRLARQRIALLLEHVEEQANGSGDFPELEAQLAETAMDMAAREDGRLRRVQFNDRLSHITAYLDRLASHAAVPGAIPSGLSRLDLRLGGGFEPGKLYLIAGHTGSGKTALASQLADHAADGGTRTIMFSMEVDPDDVLLRDLERTARRTRWDVRGPAELRDAAMTELMQAAARMAANPNAKTLYGSSVSVEEIRRAILIESMRLGGPVQFVVVDHAQVVAPGKTKASKAPMIRYLELKAIAEELRAMAVRLRFACILTAQLNPAPKGEKPTMALVREGKDLVNAADCALLIHHERDLEDVPAHEAGRRRGRGRIVGTEIIVDKLRLGMPGPIAVSFEGSTFRFSDAPRAGDGL